VSSENIVHHDSTRDEKGRSEMKVGVFGTGRVGNAISTRLVGLGHQVLMGSRTSDNEAAAAWVAEAGSAASQGTFADAAAFGELLFNCTAGGGSLEAIGSAHSEDLAGKVLIDLANPLDFAAGMPPSLLVCNTDSLGEQIQRAFPETRVVKTLNTLHCDVMVDPTRVPGEHHIFMSGNDPEAKRRTSELLQSFGWPPERILDLGDISSARGVEMYLGLWLRLLGVLQTPHFNISIVL
jgi:predicted dinucleotide-binding enzyme